LQENYATFQALNADVYGVHGFDPIDSQIWEQELGLEYRLLADRNQKLMWGLRVYNRDRIPHPSTFIIDPEGDVRFLDVHVEYQSRTPVADIIRELKQLQGLPEDAPPVPEPEKTPGAPR